MLSNFRYIWSNKIFKINTQLWKKITCPLYLYHDEEYNIDSTHYMYNAKKISENLHAVYKHCVTLHKLYIHKYNEEYNIQYF